VDIVARSGAALAPRAESARASQDKRAACGLRSDSYSHLRPAYWVAFSGVYPTTEARAHAADVNAAGHADVVRCKNT